MWKYVATWGLNAICAVGASIAQVRTPGMPEDPITAGYNGAQLISQLTDRGLWLFFLFIILAYGYLDGRRKEREIARLQGKLDEVEARKWKILNSNEQLLESNERLLERIERKLDE